MAIARKRYSTGRKILIGLVILILIAGVAFQLFINRYLPPLVKDKLADLIVKGSDSLYRFEAGKFDVSFWGRSISFSNLRIQIDSARYDQLKAKKKLPVMTFELDLPAGNVNGVGIWGLIFNKKIDVNQIRFKEAQVKLARHYREPKDPDTTSVPLWKLIQPGIRSIRVGSAICKNLKVIYQNQDMSSDFRWQFDQCNAALSGILIDSSSAHDSSRLLFAKNIELSARNIKMKTPDGLYNLNASEVAYTSSGSAMDIKDFTFHPSMSDAAFIRHFGYQHEIYKLKMPVIKLKNFMLDQWVNYNYLSIGTIELLSPVIAVSMDRNARPNPNSKKGQYPNQLVQKAPFGINVRKLTAVDGTVTYTEKNNLNQLTGRLVFPAVRGAITNITNDREVLLRSATCVADVRSGVLNTGSLHAIFRFNMVDRAGAFSVNADIDKLNAEQLRPLAKAMTSTDLQSFNMHRLNYAIAGNQNSGTGKLRMKYDDMDILINQVEPDYSFDKKGLLSFLANRFVIYKENPMDDEEERVAENIAVQRDALKSFFNFIWKTLYSSAGKIVLRPMAQRKMEKRNERKQRQAAREAASEKK